MANYGHSMHLEGLQSLLLTRIGQIPTKFGQFLAKFGPQRDLEANAINSRCRPRLPPVSSPAPGLEASRAGVPPTLSSSNIPPQSVHSNRNPFGLTVYRRLSLSCRILAAYASLAARRWATSVASTVSVIQYGLRRGPMNL